MDRRVVRFGISVICFSILLRLFGGILRVAHANGVDPALFSVITLLQSGYAVHYPDFTPPATEESLPVEPALPVFSPLDASGLSLRYSCSYRPDLKKLLAQPLSWDLQDGQPAVLIVHTHASECYTKSPGEDFSFSGAWRTTNTHYNMVSVGDELARLLEAGGIRVIHDKALHDHPSYNSAYSNARKSIRSYLKKYPTIRMVIDLHRDAASTPSGQLDTSATVNGQQSAQLMLVVGTDASGNRHPNWQKNLSLALKLHTVLERIHPGVTRPGNLRKERFNTDLTAGSLLVEVGAAGNTREEALIAAGALAEAILTLAKGSA